MPAVGDPVILARVPGFQVARTGSGTDSSTFTAETEILSVTGSLINGVEYTILADVGIMSSVAADTVIVRLREDNSSGTERQSDLVYIPATLTNNACRVVLRLVYTASATGSKTFSVTAARNSGTGNIRREASSARPSYVLIEVV